MMEPDTPIASQAARELQNKQFAVQLDSVRHIMGEAHVVCHCNIFCTYCV
jgi:hypothetical protein